MYWDPVKSNYIPVEDTTTTTTTTVANEMSNTATMESNDKAEKVKNAQKVAKVCVYGFNMFFFN